MPGPTIAVVGAGFSGTMLSLWLQAVAPAGARILLIERSGRFSRGVAYGSSDPHHLLNVPAGRMSAFPDLPLDFLHWLQRQPPAQLGGVSPAEDAFVPRCLYGCYLRHLLDRALLATGPGQIALLQGEVVDAEDSSNGMRLRLASGAPLSADVAVLATGNLPSRPFHPAAAALAEAGFLRPDPWAPAAFADLGADAAVLLVGSGLTAVDAVITLLGSGHTGPIHALSRHGLWPRRHVVGQGAAVSPPPLPSGLGPLTRCVRREIAGTCEAGGDWRTVIDALRPFAQDLWRGLSVTERARFRRHLCTWWDVHRHRMAPQVADRIDAAEASGQLQVHAGRIVQRLGARNGRAAVVLRRHRSGELRELQAARVINCTGPCPDAMASTDPLIRGLLRGGVVRPDPLRLGLDVSSDGAVLGRTGVVSRRLFAIGPLTRGGFWEITAVPDIRRQCRDMACTLAGLLRTDHQSSAGYAV